MDWRQGRYEWAVANYSLLVRLRGSHYGFLSPAGPTRLLRITYDVAGLQYLWSTELTASISWFSVHSHDACSRNLLQQIYLYADVSGAASRAGNQVYGLKLAQNLPKLSQMELNGRQFYGLSSQDRDSVHQMFGYRSNG